MCQNHTCFRLSLSLSQSVSFPPLRLICPLPLLGPFSPALSPSPSDDVRTLQLQQPISLCALPLYACGALLPALVLVRRLLVLLDRLHPDPLALQPKTPCKY
jgi:hypothetical protein